MATKILLIDDNKKLLDLLEKFMDAEGFETRTALNGPAGLSTAAAFNPDLIVLDIMLPGFDGLELLRRLRQESDVYVIMLTARAEETDKVVGLTMGADDYMVKPFSLRELVARIKAAIRRIEFNREPSEEIRAFDLKILTASREVLQSGLALDLTKTEFDLLEMLMRNKGIALTREKLLQEIWGFDYFGESRTVDVAISTLRKKLGDKEYIETVHGIGYKFKKEL